MRNESLILKVFFGLDSVSICIHPSVVYSPVDRQTHVKTLASYNFVCGR